MLPMIVIAILGKVDEQMVDVPRSLFLKTKMVIYVALTLSSKMPSRNTGERIINNKYESFS